MDSIRIKSTEAIRRAALELFSANPGASLAEVAARAGVGRATLHRHFPTREDLIRDLAISALDAADAATAGLEDEADARVALGRLFERMLPLADRLQFLSRCVVDDPEVVRRYAEQVDGLRGLVAALREQGQLDSSVPDSWAVALADSLIWTAWSAAAEGAIPSREAATLATRTFLRGVGRPDRGPPGQRQIQRDLANRS